MLEGLKKWWRGLPPTVAETESGGWRITYQDPNRPAARDRLKAVVRAPFIKRLTSKIAIPVLVVILGAAIAKWLGLS